MSDINTKSRYIEAEDKLIVETTYDNSEVLRLNQLERNQAPETGRYKGNMVHIGRVHMGDVVRLKNKGYDLLSSDPEEVKRALLYIQSEEKYMLTVPGNPISKKRQRWH